MNKQPAQARWFQELHGGNFQECLGWLAQLTPSARRIADFGCWSGEPFALLWILDADEVAVIEKEDRCLSVPKERFETLRRVVPASLDGRLVRFIKADMTGFVAELEGNYFDLAYCSNVLYQIQLEHDAQKVQDAIGEMARVARPGGWIIAVEEKIGAEFQETTVDILSRLIGREVRFPQRVGEPVRIDHLFEAVGLTKADLPEAPEWSYCYRKPAQ